MSLQSKFGYLSVGVQIFCTTLWKIWRARNQAVFEAKPVNPIAVVESVVSFVQNFNSYQTKGQTIQNFQISNLSEIVLPGAGWNTIFVDASCFNDGTTGWGAIFRDHGGLVTLKACRMEHILVEPSLAESLGLRWCLQIAKELNLNKVMIHSDASNVVDCIHNKLKIATLEPTILDCQDIMIQLGEVIVEQVKRQHNCEAHDLAQLAKRLGSRTWVGNVLPQDVQFPCNYVDVQTHCNAADVLVMN